jgi:anti-sigma factor ChrR (cupin superfamily)
MSFQHPLDKLSAAVDGELDHDSRDRVLSHLVGCDSCRAQVEAERRLKARLGSLSADHATAVNGTPFADPVAVLTSFNGSGYPGLSSTTLQPVASAGR